jgi:RES domain-containing protein
LIITAWRITKRKYRDSAFTGEGAEETGGRWNSEGTRIVYASSSISLAILEILVHLQDERILSAFEVIPFHVDSHCVKTLDIKDIPGDWASLPSSLSAKAVGDEWVRSGESLILEVPSAVVPLERNYLINPRHPDFDQLIIDAPLSLPIDERLIGRPGGE